MKPPDPSERKFLLMRVDLKDRSETPIDPQTCNAIDPTNSSAWMTLDEAKLWADTWGLERHSPLVVFGVKPAPAPTVPIPPDPYTQHVDRTDAGNANLLIHLSNGNLRYVHETKQWLRWSGSRWQIDEYETFVTGHALEVAKFYLQDAQAIRKGEHRFTNSGHVEDGEELYKWGIKCRSKAAIEAMITLARKANGVPISVNDLDRDPWLLGVDNGVIDLRTGQLRQRESREDYVTKRCRVRYNPHARAPRWEAFIAEITGAPIAAERDTDREVIPNTVGRFTPRPALARYLQKALGYSLTGSTREQKFFIAIGDGSNGKGVVFDTVKEILGPYAVALPSDAFLATSRGVDSERPTALAASLAGARFAVSSETKVGQKLDIGIIKNHTGDKEMTARRLYGNPITFTITHKAWLQTNVRPSIDHIDPATRGRLHLVPFDRRWNRPGEPEHNPALPDGDKGLAAQLVGEAEGILAWLVRGVVLYQSEGLTPPLEVVALTRDYIEEQDLFGRWLATLQRCGAAQGTLAAQLLRQFDDWCRAEGLHTGCGLSPKGFANALRKHDIEFADVSQGRRYGLTGGAVLHRGVDPASLGFGQGPVPPGMLPTPTPVSAVPVRPDPLELRHEADLRAALEKVGCPDVVTVAGLLEFVPDNSWMYKHINPSYVPSRLAAVGYAAAPNAKFPLQVQGVKLPAVPPPPKG